MPLKRVILIPPLKSRFLAFLMSSKPVERPRVGRPTKNAYTLGRGEFLTPQTPFSKGILGGRGVGGGLKTGGGG